MYLEVLVLTISKTDCVYQLLGHIDIFNIMKYTYILIWFSSIVFDCLQVRELAREKLFGRPGHGAPTEQIRKRLFTEHQLDTSNNNKMQSPDQLYPVAGRSSYNNYPSPYQTLSKSTNDLSNYNTSDSYGEEPGPGRVSHDEVSRI